MRKLLIVLVAALAVIVVIVPLLLLWLVDPDDYRDEIARRAADQLGREVSLEGPLSLKVFPRLAIALSDVGVGNPDDFPQAPPLARVGTATLSVGLWPLFRGELDIGAVTLSDAVFHLVSDATGRSNLDGLLSDAPDRPDAEPDLSGLGLGEVRFDNVELISLDLASGQATSFAIADLRLDPFRAGQPTAFRLGGMLSDGAGELLFIERLDGRLDVAPNLSFIELTHLVLEGALPQAGARLSARAGARIDLSGPDPVVVLPVLDATLAVDAMRLAVLVEEPARLVMGREMRLDLPAARLALNEQPLSARGQVVLGHAIEAELAIQGPRLDLRPLMTPPERQPRPRAEPAQADFSALDALTLSFDLRLDTLVLSDALSLGEVVAVANLRDGELVLAPLDARLLGGQFQGRATVDLRADPPRIDLQPRMQGIRVDQLAALGGLAAPVQGLGDFELSLSFSGFDAERILASLDGTGQFQVAQGALLGVDLRALVSEVSSASSLGNISRAFGGQTDFEQFGGRIEARSGVVELPDLSLSAGDLGLAGNGRLDLPAGQVDYRLELALNETLARGLPRTLREATGGRIPLAIAGPIARPVVSVDLASLAEGALRRQLEQRLRPREPRPEADQEASSDAAVPEQQTDSDAEPVSETESEPQQRRLRGRDLIIRSLSEREPRERDEAPADSEAEPEETEPEESEPEDPPPSDQA